MTAHTHRESVPGCYRCELSADEAESALRAEAEEAWVEHVRPMKQRLFFESEREEWITAWVERRRG